MNPFDIVSEERQKALAHKGYSAKQPEQIKFKMCSKCKKKQLEINHQNMENYFVWFLTLKGKQCSPVFNDKEKLLDWIKTNLGG